MKNNQDFLNEIENEFELEFENDNESDNENDNESDNEFESDSEFENDSESDNEFEIESESDNEFEFEEEHESDNENAGKLYRLFSENSENSFAFEQGFNNILHEMERDFFFGGLMKKLKKAGGGFIKRAVAGSPIGGALRSMSQLARGNMKGLLSSLAGTALSSFGGPMGNSLRTALNLELPAGTTPQQKAKNMAVIARNAYQNLAKNMANVNSRNALQQISSTNGVRSIVNNAVQRVNGGGTMGSRRVRRIYLRKGDKLIIKVR